MSIITVIKVTFYEFIQRYVHSQYQWQSWTRDLDLRPYSTCVVCPLWRRFAAVKDDVEKNEILTILLSGSTNLMLKGKFSTACMHFCVIILVKLLSNNSTSLQTIPYQSCSWATMDIVPYNFNTSFQNLHAFDWTEPALSRLSYK